MDVALYCPRSGYLSQRWQDVDNKSHCYPAVSRVGHPGRGSGVWEEFFSLGGRAGRAGGRGYMMRDVYMFTFCCVLESVLSKCTAAEDCSQLHFDLSKKRAQSLVEKGKIRMRSYYFVDKL